MKILFNSFFYVSNFFFLFSVEKVPGFLSFLSLDSLVDAIFPLNSLNFY